MTLRSAYLTTAFASVRRPLVAPLLAAALGLGPVLAASALVCAPGATQAQISVGIGVNVAPPPLPRYEQPPAPGLGYLWRPGFWGWNAGVNNYYWVPGVWTAPPSVGLLWTPGYWGWGNGAYFFHSGYWGPHVGYYGGVAYGFGYTGFGYQGGYWNNNHFYYNSAVNNLGNMRGDYLYHQPVNIGRGPSASFNGPGGVMTQPTAGEVQAWRDSHPGRYEVNRGRGYLNSDIQNARNNDDLTRLQAERLHDQTNQVRYQERVDANHDNGHNTYAEHARLNREEAHIQNEVRTGRVTPRPQPRRDPPRHP